MFPVSSMEIYGVFQIIVLLFWSITLLFYFTQSALIVLFWEAAWSDLHFKYKLLYTSCPSPNSRQTRLAPSWWIQRSIKQLMRRYLSRETIETSWRRWQPQTIADKNICSIFAEFLDKQQFLYFKGKLFQYWAIYQLFSIILVWSTKCQRKSHRL